MRASGYDRAAADWYVEPAWCVEALLRAERFNGTCWDPSCGGGNIPRVLRAAALECRATDIVERGGATGGIGDFLTMERPIVNNIVSNPPYGIIEQYARHALTFATHKVALLARLAFLEGQARRAFFHETPLARVWVSSRRISMPPGGTDVPAKGGAIAYAWFVWEHGHIEAPTIGWLS